MGERGLDTLVVRAPDNVLYLTNFWGMKGYDACVFPRDGDPVLICLEASEEDAARTSWTTEVRLFRGYEPSDPRPPTARVLDLDSGMTEAQIAAEWEGFVHGEGTGWEGKVELALGFSLVWSGPGIKTFTATTSRPIVEGEPTLFEIWVCADGYWCDHTKNLVAGELVPSYRDLERQLLAVYEDAIAFAKPGASLAELDRRIRTGLDAMGFPGQPSHPVAHGVGARAHEPPYAHQAGGGTIEEGMVLAIEPGAYWEGGGGLRVEDNFLITSDGSEKLSPFPDGIVQA